MPTAALPGSGDWMRTEAAFIESARSSERPTILLTFTPGAGSNSNSAIDMLVPPMPVTHTPVPTRSAAQEVDTLLKGAKELLGIWPTLAQRELIESKTVVALEKI